MMIKNLMGYVVIRGYGLVSLMLLNDELNKNYGFLQYVKELVSHETYIQSLRMAIERAIHRASLMTIVHTNKRLVGYCPETNDRVFYIAYTGGYYSVGKKDYVTEYLVEKEIVLTKTAKGNTNFLVNKNSDEYYYNTGTKRIIDERQKQMKHNEVGRLPLETQVIKCELPKNIIRFETIDEFIDWVLSE